MPGGTLYREQNIILSPYEDDGISRFRASRMFMGAAAVGQHGVMQTDVILVQGPLMRWCGIWGLQVQTAGTGQGMAEATLYGLSDPAGTRDGGAVRAGWVPTETQPGRRSRARRWGRRSGEATRTNP